MSICTWWQLLVCIQKRSFMHICSCLFMHKVHCSCSSCNYNLISLCHVGPIQNGFITLWPSNGHLELFLVGIQPTCPKNSTMLLFKINFNSISDLIKAKKKKIDKSISVWKNNFEWFWKVVTLWVGILEKVNLIFSSLLSTSYTGLMSLSWFCSIGSQLHYVMLKCTIHCFLPAND